MARPDSHKELVNAIVDGEIDADVIVKDAKDMAGTLALKLNAVSRNLVALRVAGKITTAEAKRMYRTMYTAISLAGFTEVAQDVQDHAADSTDRIIEAARKLGKEVAKVDVIRNADKLAREIERGS